MPDNKVNDFIKDTAKGVEYFGKIRKGRSPLMERMEDAAEGPDTPPPRPTQDPEPKKKLLDRSTGGSPPFSEGEMKKGYRKL